MHSLLSILHCPQDNFSIEIVSQFIDKLTFNGQLKEINHLIRWLNRTCLSQTSCKDWKLYPEELNMNTTKKLHVTFLCLQGFCHNLKNNQWWFVHHLHFNPFLKFTPTTLSDLRGNSPYCLPDDAHNVPLENLVLDRLIIFRYSHPLSAWCCIGIVRRNSALVTCGSWRLTRIFLIIVFPWEVQLQALALQPPPAISIELLLKNLITLFSHREKKETTLSSGECLLDTTSSYKGIHSNKRGAN